MTPNDMDLPPPPAEADSRPLVARRRRDTSLWLFSGIALLGAVLLFSILDGQRRALTAPAVYAGSSDAVARPSAPPPLYIPLDPLPPPPPPLPFEPTETPPVPLYQALPIEPQVTYAPAPAAAPVSVVGAPPTPPSIEVAPGAGEVLVYDAIPAVNGGGARLAGAADGAEPTDSLDGAGAGAGRQIHTQRLGRQATTVPQGTLIPAVLETALDSTRPGYVRAMVSRDVPGFDGSQVLIPRGSRLIGEYRADLGPGQDRAFVQWIRLIRPDGVSVAIDSPAADSVGRAGVQGRVDSHFLERFGAAVLQTTLSVGGALASRSIGDSSVIVAMPGGVENAAPTLSRQIQPTLRVEAGASVTVFVAHDLHLPPPERRR